MDLSVKEMEVLFRLARRYSTPAEFIEVMIEVYDFAK